ncbi:MAG: SGNH/GDSL hydrolase family protein [Antricoccus sp.]
MRRAQSIAIAVGIAGASAITATAAFAGLLIGEARFAQHRVEERTPVDDPPTGNGVWGNGTGKPIIMAMMGDSSAVGLGCDEVEETPGVLIAAGLSRLSGRPVRLVRVAISGSESKNLDSQVDDILPLRPDLAVVMIGANDVKSRTRAEVAASALGNAVFRLRQNDIEVVVGTCPDLGTVRPIPQPLRSLARRWSRDLAAAQVVAVVEAGGRTVSLGGSLGPVFAQYHEMWSDDGFHPSAAGYAAAASFLLPSAADALGYWPISREQINSRMKARRGTIAAAAASASAQTGAEVIGDSRGSLNGTTRMWGTIRRLLPIPIPVPSPSTDHDE